MLGQKEIFLIFHTDQTQPFTIRPKHILRFASNDRYSGPRKIENEPKLSNADTYSRPVVCFINTELPTRTSRTVTLSNHSPTNQHTNVPLLTCIKGISRVGA